MREQKSGMILVGAAGAGDLGVDGEMARAGRLVGKAGEHESALVEEGSSEPCYEAEMVVVGRPSQPLGCRWRWMAVVDGATGKGDAAADCSEQ